MIRKTIVTAALATLALSRAARAEGLSARGPNLGNAVVFVEGAPEASRAVWIRPWLAITQEQRMPFDAFGLGAAMRTTIAGGPRGWALEAQFAAGFTVPTLLPGVAVWIAPSTHVRVRGERVWFSMGLASPSAVLLSAPNDLRFPLQGELWLAFRVGPVWLGAMTAAGANLVPQRPASMVIQGAAYVSIPFGEGRESR